MKVYYYNKELVYIGKREIDDSSKIPPNSTTIPVELDKCETARFIDGEWVKTYHLISKLTLDEVKNKRIEQLSEKCNKIITGGFTSAVKGKEELYDFDVENQLNLEGVSSKIDKGEIEDGTLEYYYKGGACEPYSNNEIQQLWGEGFSFKYAMISYYKTLKSQILQCDNKEDILKIDIDLTILDSV